jgi:hypothetical protein
MKQRYEDVRLEHHEIVIERTCFRPGRYEDPIDAVRLPRAFANSGGWHWPKS